MRPCQECCETYHDGKSEPTAEAVMRARFSAYVKGKIDYIVATTHPDNPAAGGSKRGGEVVSTLRQDAQATHGKVSAHAAAHQI
jgi:SEC-C motif domain protein